MSNWHNIIESPVGRLTLIASEIGLAAILWENDDPFRVRIDYGQPSKNNQLLVETERQLRDYFAGSRESFNVPLSVAGTEFQKTVWEMLLTIPYGMTLTYGEVARRIGNERAVRAVGTAIGRNPVSILVPCHRVVGMNGDLRGFAGGLPAKSRLLALESESLRVARSI